MGRERNGWRPGEGDEQDGVRVREFGTGPRIEIDFRFKGTRCREALKVDLTPGNWRFAGRMRAEILNAIARGTFKYGDYFPDSKRAAIFGQSVTRDTVEQILTRHLAECELAAKRGNMSPSTLASYRKIINGDLIPEFGHVRGADFNSGHIRQWVLKQDCTAKTIRNKLSPLRCAFDTAVADQLIDASPINEVAIQKAIERVQKKSDFVVDPFSPEERAAFLAACDSDEERDMYTFWFETGLRPGELIAVAWRNIDWIGNTLRIDSNYVAATEKGPKTAAGMRDIELSPIAVAALKRQKANTYLADKRIWRCPRHLQIIGKRRSEELVDWESDAQIRKSSYTPIMRKAGVRWRNMYQIRHTYASTHASNGANLFWLARQLGHKTIEVLIKHYARWIPKTPDGHVAVTQQPRAKIIPLK